MIVEFVSLPLISFHSYGRGFENRNKKAICLSPELLFFFAVSSGVETVNR
jgi:hypothetical protein